MTKCPKILFVIFAITICVFVIGSQSVAVQTFNYKDIGKLKSKPKLNFPTPLVTVTTPVQIKNLPPDWRDAQLIVESMAVFFTQNGIEGYSYGKVTKSNVLNSGSYQGTVVVLTKKLTGNSAKEYAAISIALARKGGECKILGFGCHGTGSSGCGSGIDEIIDTVHPYADPFLPDFLNQQ